MKGRKKRKIETEIKESQMMKPFLLFHLSFGLASVFLFFLHPDQMWEKEKGEAKLRKMK